MKTFTVEETNLLSIYHADSQQELLDNIKAALPFMDTDMRELAKQSMNKIESLAESEYAELSFSPAEEV